LSVTEGTELVYGLIGKEVQLDPKVTETINNITWKKENNGIAKWDSSSGLYYDDRCRTDQCNLNKSTGVLILKGLKREDKGRYFSEINSKGPAKEFELIVLEPVPKPRVARDCSWTQCILACVGEESNHTKYSWKENDITVKEGNILMVEKSGEQSKSYTCVFSNPKSEEHSDPVSVMDVSPGQSLNIFKKYSVLQYFLHDILDFKLIHRYHDMKVQDLLSVTEVCCLYLQSKCPSAEGHVCQ
uniref:Natural killer cell receptor 2B4 immunoglobulin domain-containing protein n=1 Tax=Scleropages formosus TaxID=113540 RepID=A0A8C9V017_SCLFO